MEEGGNLDKDGHRESREERELEKRGEAIREDTNRNKRRIGNRYEGQVGDRYWRGWLRKGTLKRGMYGLILYSKKLPH